MFLPSQVTIVASKLLWLYLHRRLGASLQWHRTKSRCQARYRSLSRCDLHTAHQGNAAESLVGRLQVTQPVARQRHRVLQRVPPLVGGQP